MGGAKQDEEPVGHVAASPHCRKEIAWRDHHCRVHLAVACKLDGPCDCLAIPPKNEVKMRSKIHGCQHFEMSIVMQRTYFGSHHVVI